MNILATEWLLLRRDRRAWIAYLLFALTSVVAIAESISAARRSERFVTALVREEATRIAALDAELAAPPVPVEPWVDPRNPGAMGRARAGTYAILPPGPLAVLRDRPLGEGAVAVSTQGGALDRSTGDLRNARLDGLGRFDLAFVVVVLLPLAILILGFDVVARDREDGVLRLLAQTPAVTRRYLLRAILRAAPLVAVAIVSVGIAAACARTGTAASLGAVAIAITAYGAFWTSLALLSQAVWKTPAASGVACIGGWLALVVLVPTLIGSGADFAAPIPSRIERTSAAREAARQASLSGGALLSRYYEDHPELGRPTGRVDPNDFYVRAVAISAQVSAARREVASRYDAAIRAQRRIVRSFAVASPVVLIERILDDAAGSSRERSDDFRAQVDAFQARFARFFDEKTLRGEPLTSAALAERPTFAIAESPVQERWPYLALLVWTTVALALAVRSLARTRPI